MMCNFRAIWALILLCAAFSSPVSAVDVPKPGKSDSRIRYVTYNEEDVVQIIAYIGHSITLIFGKDEEIIGNPIFGNPDAWYAVKVEDNIYTFKPTVKKGEKANSSLQIQTNRHIYTFSLKLGGNEGITDGTITKDMMYQVKFLYGNDKRLASAALAGTPRNINYSALGRRDDFPYEIWDDNASTYVRFYEQQDNPAFFSVDNAGSESIIGSHISADGIIVLHGVWKQIRLRYGDKRVICIFKEDPIVMTPATGDRTLDPALKLKRK